MTTLLTDLGVFELTDRAALWLTPEEAAAMTGWSFKPEGMCKGAVCVPHADGALREGAIDMAAFWRRLGAPVVHDPASDAWMLAAGADERNGALEGLTAPDFALPDLDGRLHRLSDLRGRKVFLATWASWCGCRNDLVAWQALFAELAGRDFMVVAVAEETRGAEQARPWIEAAAPDYLCLIDTEHRVADLYGMLNVPQSVWIDEGGRIVRPPEIAGWTDDWREMAGATPQVLAQVGARLTAAKTVYLGAVKQWVLTGEHALPQDAARRALPRITPQVAEAQANFRLAVWLWRQGRETAAEARLADAARLHPQSWAIWRQAADLGEAGAAQGPRFWERVSQLGAERYYTPPDIPGFPGA